jgi:hypothetical protein
MRLTCSKTRNAHRMPCLLSKRSYSTISDRWIWTDIWAEWCNSMVY